MISRPVSVNTKYSVARQSALGRAWGEIRSEMTLSNYDKQVVCCRGEAAGPITDVAFQMMRRGLQRQSSRWSFGRAEAHASRGHPHVKPTFGAQDRVHGRTAAGRSLQASQ